MRKGWRRPSWPVVAWCFALFLLGVVSMGGCSDAAAQDPAATAGPDWPTLIAGALGGLATLGTLLGGGTYARRRWTTPPGDPPPPAVEERVAVLEERSKVERREGEKLRKKVHKIGNVVFALAHAAGIDPDKVEDDSDEDEKP